MGRTVGNPDDYLLPPSAIQAMVDRAAQAHAELVEAQLAIRDERLDAIDTATRLLNETVNRTPTEIQKEIQHLNSLVSRDVNALKQQIVDRDTAVGAAFAAQTVFGEKQEAANQKAIDKAERATTETIAKNQDLNNRSLEALRDQITDLKDRVVAIESEKRGGTEVRTDQRAVIGFAITVGFFVLAIVGFIITQVATTPTP